MAVRAVQRSCGQCRSQEAPDRKLLACSRCRSQMYCNPECQKRDWPEHKKACVLSSSPKIESAASSSLPRPSGSSSNRVCVVNIEPLRELVHSPQDLDGGLVKALCFAKLTLDCAIELGENQYSGSFIELVYNRSEEEAIELLNSWDQAKVCSMITGYFLAKEVGAVWDPNKNMFLNLLRVSALQKRFTMIERLFQIIRDLQIPYQEHDHEDRFGWNLAHFIALHSVDGKFPTLDIPEIQDLIDVKNKAGASPRDFVFWLSTPSPQTVAILGDELPLMSASEYELLMKKNYWFRPKVTPGAYLKTYFEPSKEDGPIYLGSLLNQQIDHYLDDIAKGSSPLNIKIGKIDRPDFPAHLQGQWECLTRRDLEKGEIIVIYSGTIRNPEWDGLIGKDHEEPFIDYLSLHADSKGGNPAEFIHHGFPNCAAYHRCYQGLPFLIILALEDLKANTPLFLHQGPQYFETSSSSPVTLNPQDRDRYLEKTKNLTKIPRIQIAPEGWYSDSVNRGHIKTKKENSPVSPSDAFDAWAHSIRLTYLADCELKKLNHKVSKPTLRLLKEKFKSP